MSDMTESMAGQESGAVQKIKALIREEQDLQTDEEATEYWFTLSSEEKVALTRRALP